VFTSAARPDDKETLAYDAQIPTIAVEKNPLHLPAQVEVIFLTNTPSVPFYLSASSFLN
jgi:hypothetical protein